MVPYMTTKYYELISYYKILLLKKTSRITRNCNTWHLNVVYITLENIVLISLGRCYRKIRGYNIIHLRDLSNE